jgi:hypothetical protein
VERNKRLIDFFERLSTKIHTSHESVAFLAVSDVLRGCIRAPFKSVNPAALVN